MKTLNQPAKLIAAIVIGLAFSGSVVAADEMRKDNPGANTGTEAQKDTGTHKRNMHTSARSTAQRDYRAAVAKCKTMERAERRTCIKEAKASRRLAMKDAHKTRTHMRSGRSSAPVEKASDTKNSGGN